jgi:hypothetical protein
MQLNKTCFKIDKPNAYAMIHGFRKNGKLYRQSIWLAVKKGAFPALLTLHRTPTRFHLSRIGEELDAENFTMPLKYIAICDCEYFVKNEMPLWETACSNGLFDIWDPTAPYKRFEQSKGGRDKFRIQLLRIYEIDHEFNNDDIRFASSRIDQLKSTNQEVSKIRPVISNEDFNNLKALLEHSVGLYLRKDIELRE